MLNKVDKVAEAKKLVKKVIPEDVMLFSEPMPYIGRNGGYNFTFTRANEENFHVFMIQEYLDYHEPQTIAHEVLLSWVYKVWNEKK